MDSLLGMLLQPPIVERQVVSKVIVKRDGRIKLLEELRGMNIHGASLFPGLDGFGQSVAVNLDIAVVQQLESRRRAMVEEDRRFRLWQKAEGLVRQGSMEPS